MTPSWRHGPNSLYAGSYEMNACRFLYIVGQLGGGGMERQLHHLLCALDRYRYPVTVVVWNYHSTDLYARKLQALGVPIIGLPEELGPIKRSIAFLELVKALRPELIHSWTYYLNPLAHLASKVAMTIVVGSIRGDFTERQGTGRYLGRASARWPHNQICNSVAAERAVERAVGPFSPRRVIMVPNAVRLPDTAELAGGPMASPLLVGLGSLIASKRWDRAIRAVDQLRLRGVRCLLCIAGEGPLRPTLEAQVRRLALSDSVRLPGFVDDIAPLLRDATALVHSAESEGCPNAVMEAMAHGRPVVALDSGDVARLVEDGATGFVVQQEPASVFVDRLAELVSDPVLSRSMGRAARAKAERLYSAEQLLADTLEAYRAFGWTGA